VATFSRFISCGTWEAIYILDVLFTHLAEEPPDELHADTQGQSAPVFGLAYLLGVRLLPRSRNWGDLTFHRPDPAARYRHIDPLFGEAIDWDLLGAARHVGIQRLVRDLNTLYRAEAALHERDTVVTGFRWVVGDDTQNCVFAFLRYGQDDSRPVLVVSNMTPVPEYNYMVGVPRPGYWRELLHSDSAAYAALSHKSLRYSIQHR